MWSSIPDLRSKRALVAITAAATACAIVLLALTSLPLYLKGYGDTDDAVRLVLVRELLSGRPWYHPEILRLQFPTGGLMHWSRLVDGGIAGLDWLLRLSLPAAGAEAATRALWPLLWLPLAIGATCVSAQRLAGSAGLFVAALLTAISLPALEQFRLGRIDHHNVQIVLCLVATSAAMMARGSRTTAALAGLASGLGLAIGTEAVFFHAAIAIAFALRLLLDHPGAAGEARAYGSSLAGSIIAAFLLQTPPRLWGVSVCDTLGLNLVVAAAIGGAGLAAASFAQHRARAILAVAGGAASACAYVLLHPSCLHGPMGDTPAFLQGYIDRMTEMRPFWEAWQRDHLACASLIAPALAALSTPALLARGGRSRRPEWLLLAGLLYMALGLGLLHIRLLSYANWFAIPLVAAAVAETSVLWRRLLVPTVLAAALVSPVPATAAIVAIASLAAGPERPATAPSAVGKPPSAVKCADHAAFDRLRGLPPGLVLTDPDIGAFVLAETPHAVLAGPYHRLVVGLTETFRLFSEPLGKAKDDLAARKVSYVVDCPAEANKADHAMIGSGGLLGALDRRSPPAWLTPLSAPDERLQVYALRP